MANKMLIDAAHPEETRVVVLRGNRVEEFDFESASKRQLRGNIYLAKVTRVEPSLQAAFIEYGGNRHGFLAFSEIHPDYYQIPVADRLALLEDEARSHADEDEEQPRSNGGNGGGNRRNRRPRRGNGRHAGDRTAEGGERRDAAQRDTNEGHSSAGAEDADLDNPSHYTADAANGSETPDLGFGDTDPAQESRGEDAAVAASEGPASGTEASGEAVPLRAVTDDEVVSEPVAVDDREPSSTSPDPVEDHEARSDETDESRDEITTLDHGDAAEDGGSHETDGELAETGREEAHDAGGEEEHVEHLGGSDALDEVHTRVARPRRHYKIQEVIKRRQILLVQVVKEERGNKGAALTTYLSLAGRYSVLMPNTARGGGISRKITDAEDRKRLKAIAQELEVPEGMGIILRTAGDSRGVAEVKRDFEYLLRMWETVRETTLQSSAPMLVYEEGSLIKRAIRDLYGKEIDEVLVAGEDSYKEARDFMRLLMPSHTRNVVPYRDPQPIFAKNGVEAQLDAMFSNHVSLRSGGYLVINQTEALVAIDVNSGRSTREHNIEDTALRTNLEAADEVARQLRLRDLAGLIVVDFIDMEEGRNNRAVERRIKDALKDDRARIQIGRISHFGLLEMSRQRIRTGVLEGSTVLCPHCGGAGTVRSVSSIALHILRLVEDALIKSASHNVAVRTRAEVALYILNQKRSNLLDLEMRFGVSIVVLSDPLMTGTVYHAIERGSEATPPILLNFKPSGGAAELAETVEEEEFDEVVAEEIDVASVASSEPRSSEARDDREGDDGQRRRKRRRRRRGGRGESMPQPQAEAGLSAEAEEVSEAIEGRANDPAEVDEGHEPVAGDLGPVGEPDLLASEAPPGMAEQPVVAAEPVPPLDETVEVPRRRRTRRVRADDGPQEATVTRRPRRSRAKAAVAAVAESSATRPSADVDIEADTAKAHPAEAVSDPVEAELPLALPEPPTVTDATPAPAETAALTAAAAPEPEQPSGPPQPKRSGWWQRAKATFTPGS